MKQRKVKTEAISLNFRLKRLSYLYNTHFMLILVYILVDFFRFAFVLSPPTKVINTTVIPLRYGSLLCTHVAIAIKQTKYFRHYFVFKHLNLECKQVYAIQFVIAI